MWASYFRCYFLNSFMMPRVRLGFSGVKTTGSSFFLFSLTASPNLLLKASPPLVLYLSPSPLYSDGVILVSSTEETSLNRTTCRIHQ